jgi:hypothetical protein
MIRNKSYLLNVLSENRHLTLLRITLITLGSEQFFELCLIALELLKKLNTLLNDSSGRTSPARLPTATIQVQYFCFA